MSLYCKNIHLPQEKPLTAYFREENGLYKYRHGNTSIYFSEDIAQQTVADRLQTNITDVRKKIVILELEDYLNKIIQTIYANYPGYKAFIDKHLANKLIQNTCVLYAHGYAENDQWVYAGQDEKFYKIADFIRQEGKHYGLIICIVCNPEHLPLDLKLSTNKLILMADNTLSNARLASGEVSVNLLANGRELSGYEISSASSGLFSKLV